MDNIIPKNLNIITSFSDFLLLLAISISLIVIFVYIKRSRKDDISGKFDELYLKIKEEITFAVTPKFMDLSPGVNDIIDLAVEVWRIEQRIIKSAPGLPENQLKGLENSTQKLRRYLGKYDIEIVDYKNIKYNEGLNLDILSVEKDPSLPESMVKETLEPTIMYKGQVVHKAKIVLLSNQ